MTRRDLWWAAMLAASAVTIGAAYVYGGWIPWHWAYLAPLAAAGFCTALAYGIRRSGSARTSRRLAAGFGWALAFAALLALPAGVRTARLYAAACRVEAPPGGRLVRRAVSTVVRYDGRPEYRVVFDSDEPLQDVEGPYADRLEAAGWRPFWPPRTAFRVGMRAPFYLPPEPTPDLLVPRPTRGERGGVRWWERGTDRVTLHGRRVEGFHFRWGEGTRFFVDGPAGPDRPPVLAFR